MPLQRKLDREKRGWLQTLGKKPVNKQVKIVKGCNSDFIQDLHNLIHFVVYDKNLKFSTKQRDFLKKHRTFLYNFIEEDNHKKKKAALI